MGGFSIEVGALELRVFILRGVGVFRFPALNLKLRFRADAC